MICLKLGSTTTKKALSELTTHLSMVIILSAPHHDFVAVSYQYVVVCEEDEGLQEAKVGGEVLLQGEVLFSHF